MNEQVGCLHFFANFDSGNLESASLCDPACRDDAADGQFCAGSASFCSPASSSADTTPVKRRLPGGGGRLRSIKDQQYFLTVSADCAGQGSFESSHNRSWFYFGVTFVGDDREFDTADELTSPRKLAALGAIPHATSGSSRVRTSVRHKATFTIVNLLATNLIFDHDNRPVFCNDTMTEWERLPQSLTIQYFDKQGQTVAPPPQSFLKSLHSELSRNTSSSTTLQQMQAEDKKFVRGWHSCSQRISWSYTFTSSEETVYFAMCYPFSYHRQQQVLESLWQRFGEGRGAEHTYRDVGSRTTPTSPASVDSAESALTVLTRSSSHNRLLSQAKQRAVTPPPLTAGQSVSAPPTPAKSVASSRLQPSAQSGPCSIPAPPSVDSMSGVGSADPSEGVYYQREVLCFSIQQRKVDLLTISGRNGAQVSPVDGAVVTEAYINQLYPIRSETPRPWQFPDKKFVLITCRVHPGETPASYVLQGLIDFIVSDKDPRSAALRQHFVFKIIPILNPDGVACGHYRTDTRGVNLNRMYDAPDPRFHPTIHATKELYTSLESSGRLALYIDLHAHASKRGCFVFGNAWEDDATQALGLLYPKLLSLNSVHFDFPSCDFTSRSMHSGNRQDGTTKGGTGRVALAASGSLVECYTLEASYCMGLTLNHIVPLEYDRVHSKRSSAPENPGLARRSSFSERRGSSLTSSASSSFRYSPDTYGELGRGIVVALLDRLELNPASRLPHTPYHHLGGVRSWLEKQLRLLHAEQQKLDASEKHKTQLEHNKALERLGVSLHLPILNAYNNASAHKLTRDENGAVLTVKQKKEQQAALSQTAPLRLLT